MSPSKRSRSFLGANDLGWHEPFQAACFGVRRQLFISFTILVFVRMEDIFSCSFVPDSKKANCNYTTTRAF